MTNEQKTIGLQCDELSQEVVKYVRKQVELDGMPSHFFEIFHFLKLANYENQIVTQNMICDKIKMKAPVVTLTLQSMESKGLIKRERAAKDSRKMIVSLTPKGTEYMEKINSDFFACDQKLLECMTEEERSIFLSCMQKIRNELLEGE